MIYSKFENIDYFKEPEVEFNKNTPKEILQYCVGSLLYTPATNTKIGQKIINKDIKYLKAIALCLEDAIGSGQVAEAEKCVKNTLALLNDNIDSCENDLPLIFIRVREPQQMWRLYKNCGDLLELITGFLIPKFNKDNMQDYIENFHKVKEKIESPLYILPIIESTNAIYIQNRIDNLLQIREGLDLIRDEVLNVRVGGADFSNIFGIRRKMRDTIWDVRVVANCLADIINMFSKDYVVSGAVWEYFDSVHCVPDYTEGLKSWKISDYPKHFPSADSKEIKEREVKMLRQNGAAPQFTPGKEWLVGLKKELYLDRLNGMIGKTCIHPKQLECVQKSLIISKEDYEDATQIVNASVSEYGVLNGHGKMNELRTHINWAKKVIKLASIYGVKEDK